MQKHDPPTPENAPGNIYGATNNDINDSMSSTVSEEITF